MQGVLLSTITFPEFTDLIRRNWVMTQELVTPVAMQMFVFEPIPKGTGKTRIFNEVDVEIFAKGKPEAAAVKKAKVGVGFNKTMTKQRFGMEIDITVEMRDENRYSEVGAYITGLADFCPQRRELDLTHVFTFANANSYTNLDGDTVDNTTGDGLSLGNGAHLLKFSPITYNNIVPGSPLVSGGAWEAAKRLTVSQIYSNFGQRRVMNFNTVFSTDDPTSCNEIKRLLKSTADVSAPNSGVLNVHANEFTHVELPYLNTDAFGGYDSTKRGWWGIAATGQGIMRSWQGMYGEWEAPHMAVLPEEGNNGVDSHRDIWSYGTRAAYGICSVTGRGIIFSFPILS